MLQKKERDWTVELMRIVACLMVIGCHTVPGSVENPGGWWDLNPRLLLSCFVGDGVAIFWAITGFFLFLNFDYRKLLRRTSGRILLPYVMYTVFIFYFYDVFIAGSTLSESLSHSADDYIALLRNALLLNVVPPHSEHLWYVVTYLIFIVLSPFVCNFGKTVSADPASARTCVLYLLALLLINDFSCCNTLGFSHHGIGAIGGALIFVLYGSILYHNRERLIWKGWIILAPLLFIACGFVRYAAAKHNIGVICWFTTFGLINTTLLAAFCMSLSKIKSVRMNMAAAVGSYTFPIYVVHFFVIQILFVKGVTAKLTEKIIGSDADSLLYNTLYHLTAIIIVFVISLALCVAMRLIRKGLLAALSKFKSHVAAEA